MWYKNFRHRKGQIILAGIIFAFCMTLLGTSSNILCLLNEPFDKLVKECNLPQARVQLAMDHRAADEIQDRFESLSSVKKTYLVDLMEQKLQYKKKVISECRLLRYDPKIFSSIRIMQGTREKLANLKEDEFFIPYCLAKYKNISVGDTITILGDGGKKEYRIAGTFVSPYDTSVAFNMTCLFKKLPENMGDVSKLLYVKMKKPGNEDMLENAYRTKYDESVPGYMDTIKQCESGAHLTNMILGGIFLGIGFIVLLASCLILFFIVKNMLQRDAKKIAIYKTLGYTYGQITGIYLKFYSVVMGIAMVVGCITAAALGKNQLEGMMEQMGEQAQFENAPITFVIIAFVGILVISFLFLILCRMRKIKPVHALRGMSAGNTKKHQKAGKVLFSFSAVGIALRKICRDKKGFFSLFITVFAIVFLVNFGMISLNVTKQQRKNNTFWFGLENCEVELKTESKKQYAKALQYVKDSSMVKKYVPCNKDVIMQLHWEKGISETALAAAVYDTYQGSDMAIIHGRNPENAKEIAISIKVANRLGKKIGDYITFDATDGSKKDYLVCGLFQTYYELGNYVRIRRDGYERTGIKSENVQIMVYLHDKNKTGKFIHQVENDLPQVSVQKRQNMYSKILITMIVDPQEKAIPWMVLLILIIGGASIYSVVTLRNHSDRENNEIYKCIGFSTGQLILSNMTYYLILVCVDILIALPLCYVTYPQIMRLCLGVFGLERYPVAYEWQYMLLGNGGVLVILLISVLLSCISLRKVDVRNLVQE